MFEGLYSDVVGQRVKYRVLYSVISTVRWLLMVPQIVVGGSTTPITVLPTVNTVGAGLLAMLHNSGILDRYLLDEAEFTMVESFLEELLDTGVDAQATVWANKPEAGWSATKANPTATTTTIPVTVEDKKVVIQYD
ncbi:hypothetical protein MMYC01_201536 [Madurella mycetomatis]|uniref:SMODS and SLOG-associating 2TM effector domain-containing protein n=1 Tax=Madurella mycetomatis TaxID=100816 RepID=A0A175WEM4_9PEZI|nr:hypothetical protein MMYC01_201536 [Madurella mycetomatis]